MNALNAIQLWIWHQDPATGLALALAVSFLCLYILVVAFDAWYAKRREHAAAQRADKERQREIDYLEARYGSPLYSHAELDELIHSKWQD